MLSIPVKAGGTPRGSGPRSHRDSPTDATREGPRRGWFGFKSKRKMDDYSNVRTQWELLGGDGVSVLPENQRSRYAQGTMGAKAAAARLAYREKAAKARAAAAAERERARAEAREKYEATRQQQEQQQPTTVRGVGCGGERGAARPLLEGRRRQQQRSRSSGMGRGSRRRTWTWARRTPTTTPRLGGLVRCLSGARLWQQRPARRRARRRARPLHTLPPARSRSPVRSPNVWVRSPDGATRMRSKALPDGWVSGADPGHRRDELAPPVRRDDLDQADARRRPRGHIRGGRRARRRGSRAATAGPVGAAAAAFGGASAQPGDAKYDAAASASKRSHAAARRASWPPPRPHIERAREDGLCQAMGRGVCAAAVGRRRCHAGDGRRRRR